MRKSKRQGMERRKCIRTPIQGETRPQKVERKKKRKIENTEGKQIIQRGFVQPLSDSHE